MQPETLAGLLSHLGRAGEADGPHGGLTGAQLSALRYLARANPMSRTASALAAYQATTRGTVSQTVKALVRQGLVQRTPQASDRRSVRLDLTEAGWAALTQAPRDRLTRALARLPDSERAALARAAVQLNGALSHADADTGFGTCPTCRHLVPAAGCGSGGDGAYYCCQSGCALAAGDLDGLCASYQPRGEAGRVAGSAS